MREEYLEVSGEEVIGRHIVSDIDGHREEQSFINYKGKPKTSSDIDQLIYEDMMHDLEIKGGI